jgi:hypothetical protein
MMLVFSRLPQVTTGTGGCVSVTSAMQCRSRICLGTRAMKS